MHVPGVGVRHCVEGRGGSGAASVSCRFYISTLDRAVALESSHSDTFALVSLAVSHMRV
jgi:hypothetical protein